jgi:SPP1 family predicted phage head-tail adaptor
MRLAGSTTNPGELRTVIQIQKSTTTKDSGGFIHQSWDTIATVRCKWVNVHGQEAILANAQQAKDMANVTLRYRSDINVTLAILKDSLRYQIISVDNIRERNEYMELTVQRMKPA